MPTNPMSRDATPSASEPKRSQNHGGARKSGVMNASSQKTYDQHTRQILKNWRLQTVNDAFPAEIRPNRPLRSSAMTHLARVAKSITLESARQLFLEVCRDDDGDYSTVSFSHCKDVDHGVKKALEARNADAVPGRPIPGPSNAPSAARQSEESALQKQPESEHGGSYDVESSTSAAAPLGYRAPASVMNSSEPEHGPSSSRDQYPEEVAENPIITLRLPSHVLRSLGSMERAPVPTANTTQKRQYLNLQEAEETQARKKMKQQTTGDSRNTNLTSAQDSISHVAKSQEVLKWRKAVTPGAYGKGKQRADRENTPGGSDTESSVPSDTIVVDTGRRPMTQSVRPGPALTFDVGSASNTEPETRVAVPPTVPQQNLATAPSNNNPDVYGVGPAMNNTREIQAVASRPGCSSTHSDNDLRAHAVGSAMGSMPDIRTAAPQLNHFTAASDDNRHIYAAGSAMNNISETRAAASQASRSDMPSNNNRQVYTAGSSLNNASQTQATTSQPSHSATPSNNNLNHNVYNAGPSSNNTHHISTAASSSNNTSQSQTQPAAPQQNPSTTPSNNNNNLRVYAVGLINLVREAWIANADGQIDNFAREDQQELIWEMNEVFADGLDAIDRNLREIFRRRAQ